MISSTQNPRALPSGIPDIEAYRSVLSSREFRAMRDFSDAFLDLNRPQLQRYPKKWVPDPLHQWSRQWEYPYVLEHILRHAAVSSPIAPYKILDAGSGVTFFPFFLAKNLPYSQITCCDYDLTLESIYRDIISEQKSQINFTSGDLHKLAFPDKIFDTIYCISVLEHTSNHNAVITEFNRVLKPGGILCVTFDIAINGDADIPPEKALALLDDIYRCFPTNAPVIYSGLLADVQSDDLLTTRWIRSVDKSLLPWKYPALVALKPLLRLRFPKTLFRNLTVFCLTVIKT